MISRKAIDRAGVRNECGLTGSTNHEEEAGVEVMAEERRRRSGAPLKSNV